MAFLPFYRPVVPVNNVQTVVTYINKRSQCASYITTSSSSFPSLSLLKFHFHLAFLPSLHLQLSPVVTFCLMCSICLPHFKRVSKSPILCFVCRVTYRLSVRLSNYNHQHQTHSELLSQWSRDVSARHVKTQARKNSCTEGMPT